MIKLLLKGEVPTKKNFLFKGKYGNFYRPQFIKDFETSSYYEIKQQLPKDFKEILTKVKLKIIFFLTNDNKDLDNVISQICDVLQKSQVIKNDKQIEMIAAKKVKSMNDFTKIWLT